MSLVASMIPIAVTLRGVTPLLCSRLTPEPEDPDAVSAWEQARAKLYTDEDGFPIVPGMNLFRCLANAGRHLGRASPELVHALGIAEPSARIESSQSWAIDSRAVRHPETGERRICYRPRFDDWHLAFTVLVDLELLPSVEARAIADAAGQRIGLGDFRPERGGPFGRFAVTSWTEA
jgi:hypothetical protein